VSATLENDPPAGAGTMKMGSEKGYTLVGLLAAIAVMGILMASIAPTWRFLVRRDQEEELIFRGQQYQQALERYRKQFNALPTKLEDLVKQRAIRRLYKDPITGGPFELIYATPEGNVKASRLSPDQQRRLAQADMPGGSSLPIIGVVSTSKDKALRPFEDKEYYNEWEFIAGEQEGQGREKAPGRGGGNNKDDPRRRPLTSQRRVISTR